MQEQREQTNLLSCPCLSIKGVILQSYWRASRQFSSPQCETNIRRHISKRVGVSQNDEKIFAELLCLMFRPIFFALIAKILVFFGQWRKDGVESFKILHPVDNDDKDDDDVDDDQLLPALKNSQAQFFSWWQLSSPFFKWQELCLWCGNELFCWAGMLFGFSSSLSFKLV